MKPNVRWRPPDAPPPVPPAPSAFSLADSQRCELTGSGVLVHELRFGDRRVTLDLATGVGRKLVPAAAAPSLLHAVEKRLVLLDWARRRMPVMTPTALWALEAAALATRIGDHEWRRQASADLPSALDSLLRAQIDLGAQTTTRLRRARAAIGEHPSDPDGDLLAQIAGDIATVLRPYALRRSPDLVPVPATIAGCSELEWDRVPAFSTDVGEHALRSRVLGAVWTASVSRHPAVRPQATPERLWARLVDSESGHVCDTAAMRWSDGLYVARGYVPQTGRSAVLRVDVTSDLNVPPRCGWQHQRVLAVQSWFRAMLFARLAVREPAWAEWADVHSTRAGAQLNAVQRLTARGQSSFPSGLAVQAPFLAETLLTPMHLASACHRNAAATCRLPAP